MGFSFFVHCHVLDSGCRVIHHEILVHGHFWFRLFLTFCQMYVIGLCVNVFTCLDYGMDDSVFILVHVWDVFLCVG